MKRLLFLCALTMVLAPALFAADGSYVALKLSGSGAINDSTIKANTPVSVDIYVVNEAQREGFSMGFVLKSATVKNVVHPKKDSGTFTHVQFNKLGDIKAHSGFQDKSIFDFGLYASEKSWDGALPDTLGFGGVCMKQRWGVMKEPTKVLSLDLIFPDTGKVTIDSTFFPPGGIWTFTPPVDFRPKWKGPYTFRVTK